MRADPSRFWTSFECWLSFQTWDWKKQTLAPLPWHGSFKKVFPDFCGFSYGQRSLILPMHNVMDMHKERCREKGKDAGSEVPSGTRDLVDSWAHHWLKQAVLKLKLPDMLVTNLRDKSTQLDNMENTYGTITQQVTFKVKADKAATAIQALVRGQRARGQTNGMRESQAIAPRASEIKPRREDEPQEQLRPPPHGFVSHAEWAPSHPFVSHPIRTVQRGVQMRG